MRIHAERPRRGDVWWVDLNPIVGHEQAGVRPAVVVSADGFNASAGRLVAICPMTRTDRHNPLHIAVDPPEGGLTSRSFVRCDQVRVISLDRVHRRIGVLTPRSVAWIAYQLRLLLDL